MVPKLLKRLARRCRSTSPDGEPQALWVEASERRCRLLEQVGNPLPSDWVRMYVWRRDQGRCVQCGGQERVWFEYVVPVRAGGSNTEQNIRLMCGRCRHDAGTSARRKWRRS
jgi:5-methylcytosine-specific restriction endonuclease McrA